MGKGGEGYDGGGDRRGCCWLRVERRARKRPVEASRLGGVGGSIVMDQLWKKECDE